MINNKPRQLDLTFAALAHPTRRGILARLSRGEASVGELARPFRVSAPAISKHLQILEGAGLITRRRQKQSHYCRLVPGRMKDASDWIDYHRTFWADRFAALDRYLKKNRRE